MPGITKILFPVAFSPACTAMGAYVERVAAIFAARVTILHVVDPRQLNVFEDIALYVRPLPILEEEHFAAQTDRLSRYLLDHFSLENSDRVVVAGEPSTEIAAFAQTRQFDLIAMPTHTNLLRETLLGSTTARVIDSAHCAVLTGTHAGEAPPRPREHRHWVCAIARNPQAAVVMHTAAQFALQASSALSVVHVVDTGVLGGEEVASPEFHEASQWLQAEAARHAPDARASVVAGPIKDSLLQTLAAADADVLMIGRRSVSHRSGRLTDLTYALVKNSPCPVLTV